MCLMGFDDLCRAADDLPQPVSVAVAGAADRTVLEAVRAAVDRGWINACLVDPKKKIHEVAQACEINLDGITLVDADEPAQAAVAEVRAGRSQILMKGQVSTPALMQATLHAETGVRTGETICQVVLFDLLSADRRLLLADTGICIQPTLQQKSDIIRRTVEVAHKLGVSRPRVALLAASEKPTDAMPETLDAVELKRRSRSGEFPGCVLDGPLSFDLAFAEEAAQAKRVDSPVVGAADVLIFPNLVSANLTTKAMMYTATCSFGGVLCGAACPVVFMSRADTTATRLNSLAFALKQLAAIGNEPISVRRDPVPRTPGAVR